MLSELPQSGWSAGLSLGFQRIQGKTILARRERKGPLAVQRSFYPEASATCHVYLLHPPGGVVGGDVLEINTDIGHRAEALLTTPGATKFYRSSGATAFQTQHLNASDDGCLEWFPQENIFFPGAKVKMLTRVNLTSHSRLAMWDIHCFGRPTVGEVFDSGYADAFLGIFKDNKPIFVERLRFNPETKDRLSLMASFPLTATFVMNRISPIGIDAVRDVLPNEPGHFFSASLMDDFLVVRYLGTSAALARNTFTAIWSMLRLEAFGKAPHLPRIWNT